MNKEQIGFAEAFLAADAGRNRRLEGISDLLDWAALEKLLKPLRPGAAGRPPYPVLAMLRALLLQQWYGLSDPGLEEALSDRLSFRRFCGFRLDERTPDETTLCRFRNDLSDAGLAEKAFLLVARQLQERGLIVRSGTLIDATLVKAQAAKPSGEAAAGARSEVDPDADWTRRGGQSHFGYKAHVAVDRSSGLIRRVELTSAKIYESEVADRLVCGDEAAVYADKAYEHKERRARLKAAGIKDRIMHRSHKNQAGLPPWQARRNRLISPIRAAVERVFGTLKRSYGYRQVRYFSLAANTTQLHLLAIAFNLRRALALTA